MEALIDQPSLRRLFADRIPEARNEFMALPGEASVYTALYKLYEVTAVLAHQHKIRAVKRCLELAEELLLVDDRKISNAVCSIYMFHLITLLDKRDARAEVIHYLLPRALRAEYRRQISTCLP